MSKSDLESLVALHIRANELPEPEREFRFARPRRWQFDFAWPGLMLALEVEGGVYSGGRHTTGSGFTGDCEKYNEAAILGFTILRCTPGQVKSGEAFTIVKRAMEGSEA